jgi:flagellar hook-basal body complex protein FliE
MTSPIYSNALNAYSKALQSADGIAGANKNAEDDSASGSSSSGGNNAFSDMLKQSLDDSMKVGYKGEISSMDQLAKKNSPLDVSMALTQADLTLRSVVAVRDRVINAYQEILKMPI